MSVTSFMYHDIRDNLDPRFRKRYELKPFLTTKQFVNQLNYIRNNYKIISTHELFEVNINNDDYAILTFDDGLVDHYNIVNILNKYNIKASFFVPVGIIVENIVMKTIKIQFILSVVDESIIIKEIFNHFENKSRVEIWNKFSQSKFKNNWWSKEMIFITNFLRDFSDIDLTSYISNKLFNEYVSNNEKEFSKSFFLNHKQINSMIKQGMEIGGHGYYSDNLSNFNFEQQKSDIEKTLNYISDLNQDNEIIFSYPNGGFNHDTIEILKNNNCKIAYTTESTFVNDLSKINFLKFPRISAPENLKKT